jgi:large subunit ribosomal protein L5
MKNYTPRLKEKYITQVVPALQSKMSYANVMQVPKLNKICINQGVGQAVNDKKLIELASDEITKITGQKSIVALSKKDISNFKLRKGMPIGVKVTLRRNQMYEFLDRLISVSLPGVRDFQGINLSGFDGRGNYTLGIKEQIIFPEIKVDEIKKITGLDITFVTSAKSDEESLALLTELGLPFKK